MRILIACTLPLLLGGCLARAVVDVVTLPVTVAKTTVNAASSTVDALTTSQAEADQKLGRQVRQREQCIGDEQRRAQRARRAPDYRRCQD